ncbi:MAG: hypothetical protein D3903_19150, partial [Candidatus Electrothrix sp. GM3_4]|nr:hypothetical protein [Candidatus Electrothrix sp. GM3_4]
MDGDTLLAASPFTVEFWHRAGITWTLQAEFPRFSGGGFFRSISLDGDTAVVGNPNNDGYTGSVYVFTHSNNIWEFQQKIKAPDMVSTNGIAFGSSISLNGDTLLVGAVNDSERGDRAGSAYVFTRSEGEWISQQKLNLPEDYSADELGKKAHFGSAVALKGDTSLVLAPFNNDTQYGRLYVFTRSGTDWSQQQEIIFDDAEKNIFYDSPGLLSLDRYTDTVLVGADLENAQTGAVYILTRSETGWSRQGKIIAQDAELRARFGLSVSLSNHTAFISNYYNVSDRPPSSLYIYNLLADTDSDADGVPDD